MSNPALSEKVLNKVTGYADTSKMTINGTIHKTGILLLITVAGASLGWDSNSPILLFGSMIVALILSFAIIFGPQRAPMLSPIYAFCEGLLLGSISSVYSARYPGIVSNAMFLTLSCLFIMLALYRFRVIRVTERTRSVITVATLAIAVTYLVQLVMSIFGSSIPMINDSSPMGIGFSLLVVGVAALNLLLDFSLIEEANARGAPKFMEWYGGFALLVTLVWLYLEMLRLMSKLNKR